ncbi:porin family protein [Rufibacter latericius]|uniref:PorT family protein n=1 Tax=Rufibacter latericius TaxID=2487040 RepID=A0A3M9N0W2_9BACT|nr:porin family protein [Rufibacter latericius]RNI31035.1 PorT family protein [Rufibacter latericius]
MKKILFLVAFVWCGILSAEAQTSFGVKGGLNVATIRIPNTDIDPRIGVHAGVFASTPISSRFALQPEILYSQQGVQIPKYIYTYHYLNVPLIFKGTISGGLHAQVGPQFGILLSANRKEGRTSLDITDTRNRYDGAIALGLGYDVSAWQVSARYNLGLSDIRDDSDSGLSYTNNVFQLSLGYRFR